MQFSIVSVLNEKVLLGAFNQQKALEGTFTVIRLQTFRWTFVSSYNPDQNLMVTLQTVHPGAGGALHRLDSSDPADAGDRTLAAGD